MRFFPATVLFSAAVAKLYGVSSVSSVTAFESPHTAVYFAFGELILAFLLFTGLVATLTLRAAILVFTVFVVFSSWKLHSGFTDCGCFGNLAISPAISLALNLACLVALGWATRLPSSKLNYTRTETMQSKILFNERVGDPLLLLFFSILCLSPLLFLLYVPPLSVVSASADLWNRRSPQSVVILDLSGWRKKEFDLTDLISDCPEDLNKGRWTVVFHSEYCTMCDRLVEQLRQQQEETSQVFFVSVSGADNTKSKINRIQRGKDWYGYLTHSNRYFVETPTVLILEDGIVVDIVAPN